MEPKPLTINNTTYFSNGKKVRIYALQTGSISIKQNLFCKKGSDSFSKLNILLGRKYADFMPIWTWVIDHPEGIILIDTGDIEEAGNNAFYRNETFSSKFRIWALANKFKITREDEIDNQLRKINIQPDQVSKVILTHLHFDHTNGLKFFNKSEILVNESEFRYPYASVPSTYPKWFKPKLFNFQKNKIDCFNDAYAVTKSEDILIVHTPGHTNFHCSVIFRSDYEHLFFAGDVSNTQQQLIEGEFSGSNINFEKSGKTYSRIKNYSSKFPTVYLPSHDIHCGTRLRRKETLQYRMGENPSSPGFPNLVVD